VEDAEIYGSSLPPSTLSGEISMIRLSGLDLCELSAE